MATIEISSGSGPGETDDELAGLMEVTASLLQELLLLSPTPSQRRLIHEHLMALAALMGFQLERRRNLGAN